MLKRLLKQRDKVKESLQEDLTTHFRENIHEPLLRVLWDELTPPRSIETPQYERKSLQWIQLGFQTIDPALDVRGGGKLALDSMVYFVQHYRTEALEIISADYYSWAISCVNLVVLFAKSVGCCPGSTSFASKRYEIASKESFYVLFSHGCIELYNIWSAGNDNTTEMMQFNPTLYQAVSKVLKRSKSCLKQNNNNLDNNQPWTEKQLQLYEKIVQHTKEKHEMIQQRESYGQLKKHYLSPEACPTPPSTVRKSHF